MPSQRDGRPNRLNLPILLGEKQMNLWFESKIPEVVHPLLQSGEGLNTALVKILFT